MVNESQREVVMNIMGFQMFGYGVLVISEVA